MKTKALLIFIALVISGNVLYAQTHEVKVDESL